MLSGLEARGRAIAAKARADAIARGAARLSADLPGVTIAAEADAIVLTGRSLRARLLSDARLRWIGSLLR